MKMGVYIKGSGAISPQPTFGEGSFNFIHHTGNRWQCIEPEYSAYIDAKQIRRMSRIIRMSVTAAMLAMRNSAIEKPEAVIVGTAFGCLDDTYAFLSKLVQFKEDMLSPTAFIHSTHNTIAAQIALHYKCFGYNSTYVHRSISFESALADAVMMLEADEVSNVLVGGADEIIDAGFTIMERMGQFKNEGEIKNTVLAELISTGSVAGEGAAFFSLVNKNTIECSCKISAVQSWSFLEQNKIERNIRELLNENDITSPSLVLSGFNGDSRENSISSSILHQFAAEKRILNFKNLCGEYGTATSFATWLASIMLKEQVVPGKNGFEKSSSEPIKTILIYNQTENKHHSIILLEAC